MPSMQRRRGQVARIYQVVNSTDNRGNTIQEVGDDFLEVRAAFIPQRSARAELAGQAEINVTRMIVDHDLPNVSLWSRVYALGTWWDVVTPPARHNGSRHVRHWSIDLRERP